MITIKVTGFIDKTEHFYSENEAFKFIKNLKNLKDTATKQFLKRFFLNERTAPYDPDFVKEIRSKYPLKIEITHNSLFS